MPDQSFFTFSIDPSEKEKTVTKVDTDYSKRGDDNKAMTLQSHGSTYLVIPHVPSSSA